MIDSRDERASVVGFALGWMLFAPLPSGALATETKRRQLAHQYAGFAGGASAIENAGLDGRVTSSATLTGHVSSEPTLSGRLRTNPN